MLAEAAKKGVNDLAADEDHEDVEDEDGEGGG